jgi:prepilin-type N-terminal cleavage/methylation domain-containing protein
MWSKQPHVSHADARRRALVRRRHGFTLVETLISIVLVSLLMMIVLPKVRTALARNNLRGARTTVVNLAARARAAAQEGTRVTWLKIDGTRVLVIASPRRVFVPGSNVDTVGMVQDLAPGYGVTITATAPLIRFNPSGLGGGLGGAQTITLAHGDYSEVITVDGLGRVTK